jgi:CPA2 family monovalent cation:H+ antiporter-2
VHGRAYVAVDSDIDTVAHAIKDGYHVIFGDAVRSEFIDKLNLGHASALILTMDDPVLTMRLVKRVRAYCPDLCIVVRARDATHAAELYRAGATDAVPETLESSLQLSEAVLVDLGMAMGPVIASIHEKRAEMRAQIMAMGELDREPNIRRTRLDEVGASPG